MGTREDPLESLPQLMQLHYCNVMGIYWSYLQCNGNAWIIKASEIQSLMPIIQLWGYAWWQITCPLILLSNCKLEKQSQNIYTLNIWQLHLSVEDVMVLTIGIMNAPVGDITQSLGKITSTRRIRTMTLKDPNCCHTFDNSNFRFKGEERLELQNLAKSIKKSQRLTKKEKERLREFTFKIC